LKIKGSDGSAAGGGRSDLSEWQRSTDAKALRRRRQMSGTATGVGFADYFKSFAKQIQQFSILHFQFYIGPQARKRSFI
jgi:hypothetical protein